MLKEEIKYQDVAPPYEKDRDYEEFIEHFNEYLAPFEEERYHDLEETLPSVHVIGVPRSGTTLLTQLIYSNMDVGYINNFIARFWKAPVAAIRISRQILGDKYRSSLSSEFGKTNEIYGLNEFNYLWYDLLDYNDHTQKTEEEARTIDWDRVARVIKNMIWAFEKPIVFKSFMLGWHAKWMQKVLNRTCFIWVRRNPVDNALSILDMRRRMFGSIEKWASFKPEGYELVKDLNPYEQAAGQVYYLEEAYRNQLEQIPESNFLIVQYEDVCRNPMETIKKINGVINQNGGKVPLTSNRVQPQEPSKKNSDNHSDYSEVQKAVKRFYS